MAIGILADSPKGMIIQSELDNCDWIADLMELCELAHKIKEIDQADDPIQRKAILRLMDLETDPEIPLDRRERISRVRVALERALSNDLLDDHFRERAEVIAERMIKIARAANRRHEALLAERRRKAKVARCQMASNRLEGGE